MAAVDFLPHYSYEDYRRWEGEWELYEGVPVAMTPSPLITHQAIAYAIARELGNQIEACENCLVLGGQDYKVTEDTVLKPDVAMICDEPAEAYITKAPEIVVEVVSKSSARNDEHYKFARYEEGEGEMLSPRLS